MEQGVMNTSWCKSVPLKCFVPTMHSLESLFKRVRRNCVYRTWLFWHMHRSIRNWLGYIIRHCINCRDYAASIVYGRMIMDDECWRKWSGTAWWYYRDRSMRNLSKAHIQTNRKTIFQKPLFHKQVSWIVQIGQDLETDLFTITILSHTTYANLSGLIKIWSLNLKPSLMWLFNEVQTKITSDFLICGICI
jgi:hypothetical protein